MKITLKQLTAIRELARTQSFTQAAARLHTTQSNLSLTIQEVENILGARLFHRSTKQCRLSALGNQFLPVAERVLDDLQSAIENIQANVQLEKGMLAVGTSALLASDAVAHMLATYRRAYPHIQIRLEDRTTAEHVSLLRSGHVEVVIGMYSRLYADLVQYPLFEVPLVLFAHKGLALPDMMTWQELLPFRLVSIVRYSSVGRLIDKAWWQVHKRDYAPEIECNHWGSVLAMTDSLQGMCIAPSHAVRSGQYPDLKRIELVEPTVTREISLAHLHDHELSPAASRFVELMQAEYGHTQINDD